MVPARSRRVRGPCPGRLRPGATRSLFDEYAGRLSWPLCVREIEVKKRVSGPELQRLEAEALMAAEQYEQALEQFNALMDRLNIDQPPGATATTMEAVLTAAERIGYPVLVRPSYVLGGRGMAIVFDEDMLTRWLDENDAPLPKRRLEETP